MTPATISLEDALDSVQKVAGFAPELMKQAKRCLGEFDKQKGLPPSALGELVSIEQIDQDLCEIALAVHRKPVIGRFVHALTEQGYLVGQFEFSLVLRDDSESVLWAFTFDHSGGTYGIAQEKRDEMGICTELVGDVLAHLVARVQATLPRGG